MDNETLTRILSARFITCNEQTRKGSKGCLQLAFNGHPEQVAPFRDFMRSMNMPLTLEDIGIDSNSPKMENLFQDLFHSPFMEPTAENEARLRKAMHYLSAD